MRRSSKKMYERSRLSRYCICIALTHLRRVLRRLQLQRPDLHSHCSRLYGIPTPIRMGRRYSDNIYRCGHITSAGYRELTRTSSYVTVGMYGVNGLANRQSGVLLRQSWIRHHPVIGA